MFGIIIIGVISSFNLVLTFAMAYFILKESWQRQKLLSKDRDVFHSTLSLLTDKLRAIEGILHKPVEATFAAPKPIPGEPREQLRIALQKLRKGEDPELIGKEMGYSRSEMGLLQASAGRDV
jgi:hypothetical protein